MGQESPGSHAERGNQYPITRLERFPLRCSVLGAMPTLAVGMFFRKNRYIYREPALERHNSGYFNNFSLFSRLAISWKCCAFSLSPSFRCIDARLP
jgi:hypothetical protein